MSLFSNLGAAPAPFGSGAYPGDGKYLVQIKRCMAGESQKGEGPYVAVEYTVLRVLAGYPNSNVVGASVSWIVMLRKQPAMSNLKGFFGAAAGFSADCRFALQGAAPLSPGQPLPPGAQPIAVEAGMEWPQGAQDVTLQVWQATADRAVAGAGTLLAGLELVAEALTVGTKKGGKYTRLTWTAPEDD